MNMPQGSSVQNFICASKRNFEIAATIASSWEETKLAVGEHFRRELEKRLRRDLKGWVSRPERKTPYQYAEAWFCLWKPSWKEDYGLCLTWEDYGRNIIIGIYRDSDNFKKPRRYCEEVLATVQRIDPSAKRDQWWEARVEMKKPASDWTCPKILWRMLKDGEFVEQVAAQLLEIAEVSEPVLEDWVKNKRWE